MSKYRIPVSIFSYASQTIGEVECDTIEEYDAKAEELWESQGCDYPVTNITNEFDLGDWEISEVKEDDMKYFASKIEE